MEGGRLQDVICRFYLSILFVNSLSTSASFESPLLKADVLCWVYKSMGPKQSDLCESVDSLGDPLEVCADGLDGQISCKPGPHQGTKQGERPLNGTISGSCLC